MYEAQIWISTELGRTIADLQGRLAADGLYHFFHGGACENAVLALGHDCSWFEEALTLISQEDCDCVEGDCTVVHSTCPACIAKKTLELALVKTKNGLANINNVVLTVVIPKKSQGDSK
jgi:hypothetical protein